MPDSTPPATPAAPAAPAAPASPLVIEKRDFLGVSQPVYAGADSAAIPEPVTGDRGDSFVPTPEPATPPPATPAAPPAAAAPPPAEPATPPATPAAEPPAEPARDEKGRFIPRERFNEVNEQRKAAEARLAQLEAEKAAATAGSTQAYDFDAKEKEYGELVLSGEIDKAVALRKEIRAAEQASYQAAAQEVAQRTTQQASLQDRITAISQAYEADYPGVFDKEASNFNEAALLDVQSIYAGYLQTERFPDPAVAWDNAVKAALRLHGIEKPAPAAAPAPAPAAAAPPATPSAQARVAAIAAQPPSLAAVGVGGASPELAKAIQEMSDQEFAALPAATKARLRGDVV